MKLLTILLLSLLSAPPAFSQTAAETAKGTLAAYKAKDLEGVKKYSAPLVAAAMDEKFFEDQQVKSAVEALQSWNGKVKEVRYFTTAMGLQAAAYYADADKDTFRVLALINSGYGWKQMGVSTVEKKKFLAYDKKEPKVKAGAKASGGAVPADMLKEKLGGLGFGFGKKEKAAKKPQAAGPYSVEMADGTKVQNPDEGQLKKMLSALNEDNFFLTLTAPDGGFMQAAYTAKGLDMQYKDASGHFAGAAPVTAGTAAEMFKAYLSGQDGWKPSCEWKPFE